MFFVDDIDSSIAIIADHRDTGLFITFDAFNQVVGKNFAGNNKRNAGRINHDGFFGYLVGGIHYRYPFARCIKRRARANKQEGETHAERVAGIGNLMIIMIATDFF